MRKGLPALVLGALMAFALAGCGDDEDSAQSGGNSGQPAAEAPATPAPAAPPAQEQAAAPAAPAPSEDATPPAAEAPAEAPDQQQAAAPSGDPVKKINELNDYYRAVLVDPGAITDPHQFTDIALKLCGDKTLCQIGIWTDLRDLPVALPVKVSQLKYQAFTYGRNRETKYEASLWNCDDYPDLEKEGCIPKPMR